MTTSFEAIMYPFLDKISGHKVIAAFSGGKDSCALLNFLNDFSAGCGYSLSACHVNHGIRGITAEQDEQFCKEFCEKRGIRLTVKKVNVPEFCKMNGFSIEHGARILRYKSLNEAAKEEDVDYILTAHTYDDDIENFFIKVLKGTSLLNLSSIPSARNNIIRPMLEISTQQVEEYNAQKGITPVYDESNSEETYLRNWVRKRIISEIREYNKGFFNNINNLMKESSELDEIFHEKLSGLITFEDECFKISVAEFFSLCEFEQKRIIYNVLSRVIRVERRHVDEVLKACRSENSIRIELPDTWLAEKSYNFIRIFKARLTEDFENIKVRNETVLSLPHVKKKLHFDGDYVHKEFIVRNRREGDRIGNTKLKDIFINKKIDLFERDRMLIIVYKNKIVWVEDILPDDNITLVNPEA